VLDELCVRFARCEESFVAEADAPADEATPISAAGWCGGWHPLKWDGLAPGDSRMDLRAYEQTKFDIAEILRGLSRLIPDHHSEWRERLRDLFARLAEDRFNLVLVGRFSRGKTSLMNAILGTDKLPTGIAPLTSVITTVTYGSKEQVVLKYDNRILDKEVPIGSLPQYITQQGNPGNIQRIKTAEIQLPAEILRRGFYFVDTPGLGSVIVENTLTTESFLPEADAFILVTSYEGPLSEEEMRFFRAGSLGGNRIFVVLNKHDTVSVENRAAGLAFVREQLQQLFIRSPPRIFSVSSIEGLEAKRSGEAARLAASGTPELEKELLGFLLTEKASEFLLRMCDRVREFLQAMPPSKEVAGLTLQAATLAKRFDRTTEAAESLEGPAAAFANLHRVQSCEICASVADTLWHFLCQYQYQMIVSSEEQGRFANRGGFCPFHTWEYGSIASSYGICNGYPHLLDQLSAELRDAASTISQPDVLLTKLQRVLPTQSDCVLCDVRDKAEQEAIAELAKRLQEKRTDRSKSLSAACLPHFVMLVAAVRDKDVVASLINHQATVLQRFSEDMRRYALKHDAVRRYLASDEETTVAKRGLLSVAGRERVNFSPRRTGSPRCDQASVRGPAVSEDTGQLGERDTTDRASVQQAKVAP
jgi:GTP-binding protein EngB required for normal cell division